MMQRIRIIGLLFLVSILSIGMILAPSLSRQYAHAEEANVPKASDIKEHTLRIHYAYGDKDITQLGAWYWGDVEQAPTTWPEGIWFKKEQTSDFGAYVDVPLKNNAKTVGFLVNNRAGENVTKDVTITLLDPNMNEVWITEDLKIYTYDPTTVKKGYVRVNFQTLSGTYEPYGLWYFGDAKQVPTRWPMDALPFSSEHTTRYGSYVDIPLQDAPKSLGFLINKRDTSGIQTKDMTFTDFGTHNQVFVKEGVEGYFTNPYFKSEKKETDIPEEHPGTLDINVNAKMNRSIDYTTSGIVHVNVVNNSDKGIASMRIDGSQLGLKSTIAIDPSLSEVALSVNYGVKAGTYKLPITVVDVTGGTYTTTTDVTVLEKKASSKTTDFDESLIYFMVTDRFHDGNTANNDPYGIDYKAHADGNPMGTYQGGDFKGVTKKLDYLDQLGINTIWITPIVENIQTDATKNDPSKGAYFGYHGYWASDFEKLNPHLGTLKEFHTLIDEAAKRDIRIMVDVVLNHPGYGTNDRFKDMIRETSGNTDQTMMLAGLPDFRTEDPAVRKQLVEWQTSWIKKSTTKKGNSIAFFRIDTVKHVDNTTWQLLKNEAVKQNPAFRMIGEAWGANAKDDLGYLGTASLDSLLDFDFNDVSTALVSGKTNEVSDVLAKRNDAITSSRLLGQFLSSHDEDGFLYTQGFDQSKQMIASTLQLTSKGQPVLYYGEELGYSGANNWPEYDNRPVLDFSKTQNNVLYEHYKKITHFRNTYSDLLSKGTYTKIRAEEHKTLVYARTFENTSVYIGINVTEEEQQVLLPVSASASQHTVLYDAYSHRTLRPERVNGKNVYRVTLPPKSSGGTVLLREHIQKKCTPKEVQKKVNEVLNVLWDVILHRYAS